MRQCLNRIWRRNVNEHEHNKDNLQRRKGKMWVLEVVFFPSSSSWKKKRLRVCWHCQFLLAVAKRMKHLSCDSAVWDWLGCNSVGFFGGKQTKSKSTKRTHNPHKVFQFRRVSLSPKLSNLMSIFGFCCTQSPFTLLTFANAFDVICTTRSLPVSENQNNATANFSISLFILLCTMEIRARLLHHLNEKPDKSNKWHFGGSIKKIEWSNNKNPI